jgi:hypothetical protein
MSNNQLSDTFLSDAHLADYAAIGSEGGAVMFERSPAFVLVQPRSALLCGKSCRLNALLDAQGVPTVSAPRVVAGATFN